MPTKTYYLDREKSQPVTAKWGLFWKNFTITHNDRILISMSGVKQIRAGGRTDVDGLGKLSVKLERKLGLINELHVLLNGKPLVNSPADPYIQLRLAFRLLLILGVINIAIGTIIQAIGDPDENLKNLSIGCIVIGILFFILAYFAKYRLSVVALIAAVILMATNVIFTLIETVKGNSSNGGILFSIIVALYMINAIPAIKKIKQEEGPGGAYGSQLLDN